MTGERERGKEKEGKSKKENKPDSSKRQLQRERFEKEEEWYCNWVESGFLLHHHLLLDLPEMKRAPGEKTFSVRRK